MPEAYLLSEVAKQKQAKRNLRLCEMVSKIAVKYGSGGRNYSKYQDQYIKEFWPHDDKLPSLSEIKEHVRIEDVKAYIRKVLKLKLEIWNADFVQGFCTHGEVIRGIERFPSFSWAGENPNLKALIEVCPHGGTLGTHIPKVSNQKIYHWSFVPLLEMQYSSTTASFVAGVLSSGELIHKKGISYVRFRGKSVEWIKRWTFPITHSSRKESKVEISAFWPALFAIKMPESFSKRWTQVKKPFEGNVYSAILWKIYVDNRFPKDGIPFLPARRTIYYQNKSPEGAMRRLETLRISKRLVELPNSVGEVVQAWAQKMKEIDNETPIH